MLKRVPDFQERFLRKSILMWKIMNSQDVLNGLDSTKFLQILNSSKILYFVENIFGRPT